MTIYDRAAEKINARKDRSAWSKGVNKYALEMLEDLAYNDPEGRANIADLLAPRVLRTKLLNGADNWHQYSWGGSSLIYNSDIAERLCCPSELRKTRDGERRPNSREEWLDVQARALSQAANRVYSALRDVARESEGQQ